jgi:hypothetical protein
MSMSWMPLLFRTHHLRDFVEGLGAIFFNALDTAIDSISSPSRFVMGHLDRRARIPTRRRRGRENNVTLNCRRRRCLASNKAETTSGARGCQSNKCHVASTITTSLLVERTRCDAWADWINKVALLWEASFSFEREQVSCVVGLCFDFFSCGGVSKVERRCVW